MSHQSSSIFRGELSKKTDVNGETIRYYEKIGLLPEPARTTSGYRVYGDLHLKRLSFIKRCRELGFAIKEITELLALVDDRKYTCAEIRDLTVTHLKEVEEKISDLRKMQKTLRHMVSECEGGQLPECPIVDSLFDS
jgi:MerR family mercuric resistance operon transcriptional regulator